jgi:AcrR family transcriptional regulator
MNVKRTQVERSEATRAALIGAARELFGERGYGDVGTEEIVARAGVTRGALYHQFDDKRDLFRAVVVSLEEQVIARVALEATTGAATAGDVLPRVVGAWLDVCEDPVVNRVLLLDAPGVLGWEEWRAIGEQFGLGTAMALLGQAMDEGAIARQPVRPLAHVVIGALDEAALYVARAEDPEAARAEVAPIVRRLIEGLRG